MARKLELAMTGTLKHSGERQARFAAPALPNVPELSESLSHLMCRYGVVRAALH
jgi:hypothetical protein